MSTTTFEELVYLTYIEVIQKKYPEIELESFWNINKKKIKKFCKKSGISKFAFEDNTSYREEVMDIVIYFCLQDWDFDDEKTL